MFHGAAGVDTSQRRPSAWLNSATETRNIGETCGKYPWTIWTYMKNVGKSHENVFGDEHRWTNYGQMCLENDGHIWSFYGNQKKTIKKKHLKCVVKLVNIGTWHAWHGFTRDMTWPSFWWLKVTPTPSFGNWPKSMRMWVLPDMFRCAAFWWDRKHPQLVGFIIG
jgi:hypothetical protein